MELTTPKGGELVIGVVGPTGTDLDAFCNELVLALRRVHYESRLVHLSKLFQTVPGAPWLPIPKEPENERIRALMNAGDQLCDDVGRNDAVALLGIADVAKERGVTPTPQHRRATILRSLKRPEEVDTLRQVYGPWFLLIAALTPREHYLERLIQRQREKDPLATLTKLRAEAETLIERDELGGERSTQNVSGTFHLADAFVSAKSPEELQSGMQRFVDLVFGNRFITPSRDEYGMFHAYATSLRSASPSRQVGAAIAGPDGEVIAMGMNDVPKAGGGFVWDGEPGDFRDHRTEVRDPSHLRRQSLVADVLDRLTPWFSDERSQQIAENINSVVDEAWETVLRGSPIKDVIEFQRAEHAEAAALADAARRGVSIRGSSLYTTTYPCHLCAKEIVTSGIERVVFLEPYPKSKAVEFYPGAITLDEEQADESHVLFAPFKGVAPRRYIELFAAEKQERVEEDGTIVQFEESRRDSRPHVGQPREREPSYLRIFASETVQEQFVLARLEELYGKGKE
jgi:deoxycytidylate deaminase